MKLIKWIAILFIIVFNNGCASKEIKVINCYNFPSIEKETITHIKNLNNKKVDILFKELLILKKEIEIDCDKKKKRE